MGRSAGVITIRFEAGTAGFVADVAKAKASVKDFGTSTKFNMLESTAAIRTLEGNFQSSTRAVSRFVSVTLGLGPVMAAAFPVIGAVLLGKAIVDVGEKVGQFFKDMANAPEKIRGAFRAMGAPLAQANDETRVAIAKLEEDLAKLEGHRQNTAKLALEEVRLEADKLADALDKDLEKLHAVLEEQKHNWLAQLFGASGAGKEAGKLVGGETGIGGWRAEIAHINDVAAAHIAAAVKAKDKKAAERAETERDTALLKKYGEMLDVVNAKIAEATPHKVTSRVIIPGVGAQDVETTTARDQAALEVWQGVKDRFIAPEMEKIPLDAQKRALVEKKQGAEAGISNAEMLKPYRDALKNLNAQIGEVEAKLRSVGQPEGFRVVAEATAVAKKEIAKLNEELEKHHVALARDQEKAIQAAELAKGKAEAELQWATSMEASNVAVRDRITSLTLLTAAIGKGYEATKAANVETRVMTEMKGKYNDPAFAGDKATLRERFEAEYEAEHGQQVAATIDQLNDQIEMERALAKVQEQGAEAVRAAALEVRIARMEDKGATAEQIQKERDLFAAQRTNVDAQGRAKIAEEIANTRRLTEAQLQGAEAARKAALENKYLHMEAEGAKPETIAKARQADQAEHARLVTAEALKTGMAYKDQLDSIDQQIVKLQDLQAVGKGTVEIAISLRDLENQRLKTLAEQALQLRRAKDGLRAFFLEMQMDAKSAAQVVYESLKSALDRTNDELAKLFTGQKTSFGRMLQQQGEALVKEGLVMAEHAGIKAIAKKIGVKPPAAKREGQTPDTGIYVIPVNGMAGQGGSSPGGGVSKAIGDVAGSPAGKSIGHAVGGFFGSLFKALLGKKESVTSSITYGDAVEGRRAG
ncbi:MAG: hypothetical protein LAQ69_22430 [Acidobacteriia bacterium]|nr:hypothetical protein [Terriglobia bacterium]